jgi:hypothetical protein
LVVKQLIGKNCMVVLILGGGGGECYTQRPNILNTCTSCRRRTRPDHCYLGSVCISADVSWGGDGGCYCIAAKKGDLS